LKRYIGSWRYIPRQKDSSLIVWKQKVIISGCDSRHQQTEIQDIEAVVSFTYLGTELTRENEEVILQ
jgi:hypothetical protein